MSDLTVRPLSLIHAERAAFGLRSHDYARYRAHCSHRLHTLRRALRASHPHPGAGKGRDKQGDKEREHKKLPDVPLDKAVDAHLLIHLYESERAFAHSQELLPTSKHHALARLRRSTTHATALQRFLPRLPPAARAELLAYHAHLRARHTITARHAAAYERALVLLACAHALLAALAAQASSSTDQALYTSAADAHAPELRFLASELGHPAPWDGARVLADVTDAEREALSPGLGALLGLLKAGEGGAGAGAAGGAQMRPLVWMGREVGVREPELVEAVLKVQRAEDALKLSQGQGQGQADDAGTRPQPDAETGTGAGKGRAKGKSNKGRKPRGTRTLLPAYDGLLLALSDAEDLSRRLAESSALAPQLGLPAVTSGSALGGAQGSGTGTDMAFLHSLLTYRLLATRIERDLLLVRLLESPPTKRQAKNPAAAADAGGKEGEKEPGTAVAAAAVDDKTALAILRTLDGVLQSLEQMRALAVVDEHVEVVGAGVERRAEWTRARRIGYLARMYAGQGQYAEALALLARGEIYLRSIAVSSPSPSPSDPSIPSTDPDPPELTFYPLPAPSIARLAHTFADLALQLKKDWYAQRNGGRKPVFYDVAFNYVEVPLERVRARAGLGAGAGAGTVGAAGRAGQGAVESARAAVAAGTGTSATAATGSGEKRQGVQHDGAGEDDGPGQGQAAGGAGRPGWSGYLGGWWGRK